MWHYWEIKEFCLRLKVVLEEPGKDIREDNSGFHIFFGMGRRRYEAEVNKVPNIRNKLCS